MEVRTPLDISNATVHVLTPWLTVGSHTLKIFWDNAADDHFVQINGIRFQTLWGLDANTNGIKEWVERRLDFQSGLEVAPRASAVSPVCMEGRDPYLSLLSVSGAEVQQGVGDRWYANVPLSPTRSTSFRVFSESAK